MLSFDPRTTALVMIDLQKGIVANNTAPHVATDVVARSATLASVFRDKGALVVLVTVDWHKGFVDATGQITDIPANRSADGPTDDFAAIVPEIGAVDTDLRIVKRQWGAFHGTELDLQLRRRGVTQIVLTGIATNMGVESTARVAWEHGYQIVFVEDATTSFTEEMHGFAMTKIFPRLGQVRSTDEVIAALG